MLDNWYKTNIADKNYDKYVSKEAGFCGDKQVDKNAHPSHNGDGYGTNDTSYASYGRLHSNITPKQTQTPTYSCNTNDLYTVTSSSKGNKALTYPVGLITSDEVVYAGGFGGANNKLYWLYTNINYFTMSPYDYSGENAAVFIVNANGYPGRDNVTAIVGVRPVVNLASDVTFLGSGTTTDPFRIG